MLHPAVIPSKSKVHGQGLLSTKFIPLGTVVWHPCPTCQVIDAAAFSTLTQKTQQYLDEYGIGLSDGSILLPCSNAQFFNHSCDANVLDHGLDFGVAVRDIPAGTELFCDYRSFLYEKKWEFDCDCLSESCEKIVKARGIGHSIVTMRPPHLLSALLQMRSVEQPLRQSLEGFSSCFVGLFRDPKSAVPLTSVTNVHHRTGAA